MKETSGCLTVIGMMIGALFALAILMALPTMLLWNAIVPDITNYAVTELSFWQALGLNLLCGILFKSSASTSTSKSE
jgi:hypothetical protein